jgi:hypothetical protein
MQRVLPSLMTQPVTAFRIPCPGNAGMLHNVGHAQSSGSGYSRGPHDHTGGRRNGWCCDADSRCGVRSRLSAPGRMARNKQEDAIILDRDMFPPSGLSDTEVSPPENLSLGCRDRPHSSSHQAPTWAATQRAIGCGDGVPCRLDQTSYPNPPITAPAKIPIVAQRPRSRPRTRMRCRFEAGVRVSVPSTDTSVRAAVSQAPTLPGRIQDRCTFERAPRARM